MLTQHSTKQIKETERFEFWQSVISDNYVQLCCEPGVDEDVVTASLKQRRFGNVVFNDHEMNLPMRYRRNEQDSLNDQRDDLQFLLLLTGTGKISQNGKEAYLRPGNMVMYDSAKPFLLDYSGNHHALNIQYPKQLLSESLYDVSPFLIKTLTQHSALGNLVANTMVQYTTLPEFGLINADARLSSALLDMVSTALLVEFSQDSLFEQRKYQKLEHVKRSIKEHIGDPELNVGKLAEMHHMTVRTLNRLFAVENTTATKWIWKQRLEGAYQMLNSGMAHRVSDVALQYGFNDFSHFSRTFKKSFLLTPKQVLEQSKLR